MESLIDLGYWGLFIGSFLASTVIPMSADILLIGILALGGNIWWCLAIATIGNWLGGLTSYWIGWLGKWKGLNDGSKLKKTTRPSEIENRSLRHTIGLIHLVASRRRHFRHCPGFLQNLPETFRPLHAYRTLPSLPCLDSALYPIRRQIHSPVFLTIGSSLSIVNDPL